MGNSTPSEIGARVKAMSKEEIDELIRVLRESDARSLSESAISGCSITAAPAETAGELSSKTSTQILQNSTDQPEGLATAGSRKGRFRMFTDGEFWKATFANVIPWVLAILLAPIIVPWTFERDRAAAQPKISVEYAFLSRHSQPVSHEATGLINEWVSDPIYKNYRLHRLAQASETDLAMFAFPGDGRLGPKMYEGFQTEISSFGQHLLGLEQDLKSQLALLEVTPDRELRSFAFEVLDDPSILGDSEPRDFIRIALIGKSTRVQKLQDELDSVARALVATTPEIRVRLTLLNRGATDGLVRHHGEIQYRGRTYEMTRTTPPSADLNSIAVPVFQTNSEPESYSASSIGKIEQDSMVEFWYAFHAIVDEGDVDQSEICRPGESVQVTLFDQNRNKVQATLECNQE